MNRHSVGGNSEGRPTLLGFTAAFMVSLIATIVAGGSALSAGYDFGLASGINNEATFANGFDLIEGKNDIQTAHETLRPTSDMHRANGYSNAGIAVVAAIVAAVAGIKAKGIYNRL